MNTQKLVLGIETSCDDTSLCLMRGETGSYKTRPTILSHRSFSQDDILKKWKGVVPEIAARAHLDKIPILTDLVFSETNVSPKDIDMIGVTTHPGLLGPLLTGINLAKTLGMIFKKPIVSVNHLFAHLEAVHIDQEITYPYIGLIVSGGHSLYMKVSSPKDFEVLGSTIDDAAGEAFDKGGKLMGLDYPSGPIIDKMARDGDPLKYPFPIGLKDSKDCRLSYSGVKTSLRTFHEKNQFKIGSQEILDQCASYQHAIVSALKLKMKYAIGDSKLPIVVGGGVACNSYLRSTFKESFKDVHFVTPKFCTDNGAMIANYALRIEDQAVAYPDHLDMDAKGRFINKKDFK